MIKSKKKRQAGQVLVEMVLLIVVGVSLWLFVLDIINKHGWMKKLMADGPWPRLDGMIQAGVWQTGSTAKRLHPNNLSRSASKTEE